MKKTKIVAVMGLVGLLAACDNAKDWMGFVYPDQNNTAQMTSLGNFASFAQCKAAAISALRAMPGQALSGFECGFKCRATETGGPNICEERRR